MSGEPDNGDKSARAEGGEVDVFVWPPRPGGSGGGAPREDGTETPREPVGVERERAASVDADRVAPPALAGLTERWIARSGALVREIERTWLGLAAAPFDVRAADAGWEPDLSETYCARCGTSVGPHEGVRPVGAGVVGEEGEARAIGPGGCHACAGKRLAWDRAVRLGPYEGFLRDAVHDLKYTAFRSVGTALGRRLARSLRDALREAHRDPAKVVLVPVPPSFRRRMARGIDHTLTIARAARRSLPGARLVTPLRRAHRRSQVELAPSARRTNVAGAFRGAWSAGVRLRLARVPPTPDPSWTFVVVDDVRTTGATMTQACRTVGRIVHRGVARGDRAEIWAAVAAVAPEPEPTASTFDRA